MIGNTTCPHFAKRWRCHAGVIREFCRLGSTARVREAYSHSFASMLLVSEATALTGLLSCILLRCGSRAFHFEGGLATGHRGGSYSIPFVHVGRTSVLHRRHLLADGTHGSHSSAIGCPVSTLSVTKPTSFTNNASPPSRGSNTTSLLVMGPQPDSDTIRERVNPGNRACHLICRARRSLSEENLRRPTPSCALS